MGYGEHYWILNILINSDERIKRLLKLKLIEQLGVKFIKHPESAKFCIMPEKGRHIWNWAVTKKRVIMIPLDEHEEIIPYDKDERLFTLAHEFGHIILGEFSPGNCEHKIKECLSKELRAHAVAAILLQIISVQFDKLFWNTRLKHKLAQCEECVKILFEQRKCPKEECKKIKESLEVISQYIKQGDKK